LARAFCGCHIPKILRPMLKLLSLNKEGCGLQVRVWGSLVLLVLLSSIQVCAAPLPPNVLSKQPIEDVAALRGFYESLARTQATRGEAVALTRILHYGDSHVAADTLTGALRQHFQRDFGNAGSGFLYAARPWDWYVRASVTQAATAGWRVDGLKLAALSFDNQLGIAGLSFTTARVGERMQISAPGERFEFALLQQPGAGAIEVWLDGQLYHPALSLAAPEAATLFVPVEAERAGTHALELRTVSAGPVRVFGLIAECAQSGVIYDAFGINGARATRPLLWDWQLLDEQLADRAPALIVIAYGSNEAGDADLNLPAYRQSFAELLQRFGHAAPDASLLVIAPPDRTQWMNGRWQSLSHLSGVIEAQRQAARANGAAFWDLHRAMGGAGSINRWVTAQRPPLAQADRVHLTAAGYRLVADALYKELLDGYVEHQKQQNRRMPGDKN
jgi:lysophospholipase L1-like esterase